MSKPAIAWNLLLWMAFLWWQGGFMFYSGIVVYIATDVLESAFEQGRITARVMLWLNGLGTATIVLLFVDLLAWGGKSLRPRGMWFCWLLMVLAQSALWWLREVMLFQIDYEAGGVRDKSIFHQQHEWYMRLWSILWGTSLVYMIWLISRGQGQRKP